MYTNSFIEEQMAQPCDREEIGVQLQVAAEGIDKANCPEFKGLQDALKELSELLIEKADSQNASQNASATATQSVNAASAAAPPKQIPAFKQQTSTITFKTFGDGTVKTNYYKIMDKINKFFNSIDDKINKADKEDRTTFTERKQKYEYVKQLLNDATTEDEVEKIITENEVKFDSNSILSGGTRKRKNRRNRTQRKRAKTLKKKKNKAGKR